MVLSHLLVRQWQNGSPLCGFRNHLKPAIDFGAVGATCHFTRVSLRSAFGWGSGILPLGAAGWMQLCPCDFTSLHCVVHLWLNILKQFGCAFPRLFCLVLWDSRISTFLPGYLSLTRSYEQSSIWSSDQKSELPVPHVQLELEGEAACLHSVAVTYHGDLFWGRKGLCHLPFYSPSWRGDKAGTGTRIVEETCLLACFHRYSAIF